jgi:phosphoglycerate dehydrogenase-like enzyme
LKDYRSVYEPAQLSNFDVVISLKPKVSETSLEGVDRLCAIGRCGVGYDNVDLQACTKRDIAVFITPAAVVRPVAESIVLFVLALSHNLVVKDRLVRRGRWTESTRQLGAEPRGRIVGTIGLGNIAKEAIKLLRPFGPARFLAYDPYASTTQAEQLGVEITSLDELLRNADYVLVNCALTPETRGLIGERQLGLMKPTAVIINTARGPIIEEKSLSRALGTKQIRGAAIDVFETEPLPEASPLLALDNVILTSHSIAWTEELFRDMGRADCEGALAVMQGKPPKNIVNRDVLERPGFRKKLEKYRSLHLERKK